MTRKISLLFSGLLMSFSLAVYSQSEDTTAKYFETIQNNPLALEVFLKAMPKGGDLHNHNAGSTWAENLISYAKGEHLCVDSLTLAVMHNPYCDPHNYLEYESFHPKEYNAIIDAWSMRDFIPGKESSHEHFFASFEKFLAITSVHTGEILTEIIERAGLQNESYVELMVTPDNNASGQLGKQTGWDPDLEKLSNKLLKNNLLKIVDQISERITQDESLLHSKLHCETNHAKIGCKVKVRYLYQVLREQPPENVFAQLLAGFELANKDPRFVGINMVQAEDGKYSMQDYDLHMQMVNFLHHKYPHVHISLHAGELIPGLVSKDGLRDHIRKAVEIAHAERIGHGVDISYEDHMDQLLKEMANKKIMVEINLVSNEKILGISGKEHPLPLYMNYSVPVALSTDDEGVLRTDMTQQYMKAVSTYHFSYKTLKNFVRNSITYSFLPGKNLWQDSEYTTINSACQNEPIGTDSISAMCKAFLDSSEKAQMQWDLEKRFNHF